MTAADQLDGSVGEAVERFEMRIWSGQFPARSPHAPIGRSPDMLELSVEDRATWRRGKAVETGEDFDRFVGALRAERSADPDRRENGTLPSYLESPAAWTDAPPLARAPVTHVSACTRRPERGGRGYRLRLVLR